MLSYFLTKFEMKKNIIKMKFSGFYSRNDFPKIKDGTYVL